MRDRPLSSSFRDPSGFLFEREGELFRQVNRGYREHYDALMTSGLYARLTGEGRLVSHEEVDITPPLPEDVYRVLKPRRVPFISYPYEWCFGQLQSAALATLALHEEALDHGMSLKDASAYNIQFVSGRPVLIDTLSFERANEGAPWVAYRQYCQHFLAPLAMMAHVDIRLNSLFRVHMDGIPLDLAARLLPRRTYLNFGIATHVHLHARYQRRYAGRETRAPARKLSENAIRGLIQSLRSTIENLRNPMPQTEWGDYYSSTNYSPEALAHKAEIVGRFLDACRAATVWDLGANDAYFSRLAAERGAQTVAFDVDPVAVEKAWIQVRQRNDLNLLPLLLDLTNPSGSIGWASDERMNLEARGPVDVVLALALIHHLAIGNNVPMGRVAEYFAKLGRSLIIEFVPKSDSQVVRLLASREDVFPDYSRDAFEQVFSRHFSIEESVPVKQTERHLYRMRSRTVA